MPVSPVLRTFVQYLIAFFSRPEVASDVISGNFVGPIVHDTPVKFRDPRLNRYREILPAAVGSGIFDRFLNFSNCHLEVASHVISGVFADQTGMDVRTKFGDSTLNRSRDIRLPHVTTDKRHRRTQVIT